jgi:hypothetical protein
MEGKLMKLSTWLFCISLTCTSVSVLSCEQVLNQQKKVAEPSFMHSGLAVTLDNVRSVRTATLDGMPAIHIVAGSNRRNVLHITLLKAFLREGCVSMNRAQMQAHWHRLDYRLSDGHPTEADVVISSVTPEEVIIKLSATLVSPMTGKYLKVSPSVLVIRGPLLDAVTSSH